MNIITLTEAAARLSQGAIGIIPTDTIYGIVGQALNPGVVERMYALKVRDEGKPFIVLVAEQSEIMRFSIPLTAQTNNALGNFWPGAVSVILKCGSTNDFSYLHRGVGSLAFRVPANASMQSLLRTTGPLVAPSANPAGMPPANTITRAYSYFHDSVDFYVDGGEIHGSPSTLLRMNENGTTEVLRP